MLFNSEYWVSCVPLVTVEADDGVKCVVKTGEQDIVLRMSRANARKWANITLHKLDECERSQQGRVKAFKGTA